MGVCVRLGVPVGDELADTVADGVGDGDWLGVPDGDGIGVDWTTTYPSASGGV